MSGQRGQRSPTAAGACAGPLAASRAGSGQTEASKLRGDLRCGQPEREEAAYRPRGVPPKRASRRICASRSRRDPKLRRRSRRQTSLRPQGSQGKLQLAARASRAEADQGRTLRPSKGPSPVLTSTREAPDCFCHRETAQTVNMPRKRLPRRVLLAVICGVGEHPPGAPLRIPCAELCQTALSGCSHHLRA